MEVRVGGPYYLVFPDFDVGDAGGWVGEAGCFEVFFADSGVSLEHAEIGRVCKRDHHGDVAEAGDVAEVNLVCEEVVDAVAKFTGESEEVGFWLRHG